MQSLKLAIIQSDIVWEDVESNLTHFADLLETVKVDTDLIMLPEMFTTGFSMNVKALAVHSVSMGLPWMQEKAKEHCCVIAGSMMVEDSGKFFNRLFYVFPDGTHAHYDKKHLFSMGNEQEYFHAGTEPVIVEVKGWRIKPLVCYDVRFPSWCRNREDYDLLTFHASFPERRIHHWDILLQARAVENLCYVAAVNRVGADAFGIEHNGSSQILEPDGTIIKMNKGEEVVLYATLSKNKLLETRQKFPFLQDRDI
ncbi:MAG: amidohydrolase [Bacteroidia bacterium]|nr:amidohydrolase [Bacteroidia bacterium]